MLRRPIPLFFIIPLLLLAGCATSPPEYKGFTFPATAKIQVVFQEKDVPAQCSVFSHLIIDTPTGLTGKEIGERITRFAQSKGADIIYVGLSRQSSDEPKDFEFFTYGPKNVYKFGTDWFGWKFGFDNWEDGGSIVGFGYNSWNDNTNHYSFGMKIQAVLLRCQPGTPTAVK
jgi:hypothetical protein